MQYLTSADMAVLLFGAFAWCVWLCFYAQGRKYASLFEPLDEKDFPLKEVYFVGYAVTLALKISFKRNADQKLRKCLESIYENKYAEYYLRVSYAQRFTMVLTVAAFAAPLYCMGGGMGLFFLTICLAAGAYFYYGVYTTANKVKKRSAAMLSDFTEMVSQLALLVNAGMVLREAWASIAKTGDGLIYQEMRRSAAAMSNGVSEQEALASFGQRCMIPESKKFASVIVQSLTKGNKALSDMLIQQSKEVWEAKKQAIKRQGELANGKLIIPICITFIGILIMVIIPIFSNLGA